VSRRLRIQFPPTDVRELDQDETYFYLLEGGEKRRIRLHDYDLIFQVPGLYEQLVYERLKCQSPQTVVGVLSYAVSQSADHMNTLRVLDLGAGNGMVGDELKKVGVSRSVAVDIIADARDACERDRPGAYDAYYVVDLCCMTPEEREEIESWSLDTLVSVAALGFGDIPPQAFVNAFNLISEHGWVAFNIKETFLDHRDTSGFSRLIRELIFSEHLDLYHLQRYRHRYSVEGQPLYYFALGGRKQGHIPDDFVKSVGLPT